MRHEAILRWADALESGEYRQGKWKLRSMDFNEFCVLGVLCDVVKDEVGGKWSQYRNAFHLFEVEGNEEAYCLPNKVVEYMGFSLEGGGNRGHLPQKLFKTVREKGYVTGSYINEVSSASLAFINDNGFADFPSLAKVIRKWVEMDQKGELNEE